MPSSLDRIFSAAGGGSSSNTAASPSQLYDTSSDPVVKELPNGYKRLASGIVLDASGKPCRQCTSGSAWMGMMKRTSDTSKSASSSTSSSSSSSNSQTTTASSAGTGAALLTSTYTSSTNPPPPSPETDSDCPPDVDALGRATWTLLHSMAASYPTRASPSMQETTRSFIASFSQLYPCGYCAEDFRGWMKQPGNEVRTESQDAFGDWACRAHNAVNVKLGKGEFDCGLWRERWRDGWRDGRCG